VDADARTDVARRRVVVPRHVGVMMVAMMLPSLVPMLWRYRHAVGRRGETRLGRLTALVGVGYFFVWTAFGMAAFPLGAALAGRRLQGLFGRSFQLEVRSEA
jgi:predicted metal-binding membrane protein